MRESAGRRLSGRIGAGGDPRCLSRSVPCGETTQLELAGSAWRVGTRDGLPGLERRVPLGVQEAAEQVMRASGSAGERLSEAWHAAFGVSPDPSRAYGLAIKAVEDALKPVVSPEDAQSTLGKMIGVIRGQAGWSLALQRASERAQPSDVLVAMLRTLWDGQVDRHGGDPAAARISQEAAETAVLLAVPLVYWFTSGRAYRSIG